MSYNEIEANIVENEQNFASVITQLTGDSYAIDALSNLLKR
jgi:hypothetical protein